MTKPTDLATAEKRAYSRGYDAGRRRKVRDMRADRRSAEADAFERRAFLAALPACIGANDWKRGEKPITSLEDRTQLARDFAAEARKKFYP